MSVFSCRIVLAIAALASSGVAYAQTTFEAASIKLAPGGGAPVVRGGPGSSDPTLASFENIDLFSLVSMAYGVKRYQLLASEWLSMSRFEISARVPQGATVDQYRLMLQNLLAERFKLATHHDRREMQTYELVVAKSGSKLKESAIDPAATVNDGCSHRHSGPVRHRGITAGLTWLSRKSPWRNSPPICRDCSTNRLQTTPH